MPKPFLIMFLMPIICLAQHQLTIEVTGVANAKGNINIGIYTCDKSFLKSDQLYKGTIVKSEKGITSGVFEDLPKGTYALAVFHDENGNAELDTNLFGIPKEPLGFSFGKLKTFGPPSFEECSFSLDADMQISVSLE